MRVLDTPIADLKVIEPAVFADARGFFFESFNRKQFCAALGAEWSFVQDNHSHSARGVLRGLHYQLHQPQGKLVRVLQGCVRDVAVDLRRASPTFGQHLAIELNSEEHRQLWIPPGFAHGFLVLSESADVLYKTTDYYAPDDEYCLRWDDADLHIDWQLHGIVPQLSAKDASALLFNDAPTYP